MKTITKAKWKTLMKTKFPDKETKEPGTRGDQQIIIEPGKPTIARAYYSNRWYEWELIE
jgi:hypothetical protein